MEGQLAVPFHFAVEFLVLVVVVGAALDSLRANRHGAGVWALWQALGFTALAAAQAAHGALVVTADGDQVVLAMRAGGFLLLALAARPAIAVAPRVMPIVAGTSVSAIFLPGPQAGWAFVPTAAAIVVAARGVHAHRRDQDPTTFAFAAAFVAFAGGEVATALAPPGGGTPLAIAHAARGIGGLLLARWLWTSVVGSVRARFVAAFVVVLSILVIVISGALNLVIGNTLQDEELKRLQDAATGRAGTIQNLGQNASSSAGTFTSSSALADEVAAGDGARTEAFARVFFEFLPADADFLMVVDRGRRVVVALENGPRQTVRRVADAQAIRIAGSAVVAEALDGRKSASPQAITFSTAGGDVVSQVVVLGAAPSRRTGSRTVVGAMVVGYRIDRAYLSEVRQDTGADATLLVGTRVSASTLGPAVDVERALQGLQSELRTAREDLVPTEGTLSFGGESHVTSFVPVRTEDDQVAGMLALSRRSEALAGAQQNIARTLFLITLAAMAAAAALAYVTGGRVTKPIRSLTEAVRELRGGHLGARARVSSRDEVGSLGTAFNEMAAELQRATGALRTTAAQEATLRARMEAILESMSDGVVALDPDGRVVTCNRAAAEMIGRKPDWTFGRRADEVLDGSAQNGRPLAALALGGASGQGMLRHAKGTRRPVAITSAPLRDSEGYVAGRVVVVRDVSVEQQAERMKSEFLSNVSHELRTPITPIKGYAEIMRRKKFPRDKAEQFLDGILESTGRLERIVEILVDFAAIEAGRLKPKSEAIPVRGLMDDIAARWRGRGTMHRLVRKGGEGLVVVGDMKLLQRSLDELMDNAVKFSPQGGQIELSAEPGRNGSKGRKASNVRITVRDHGIGIEPEQMPDLFQDFRQLDGSETRTYGGLGLGLAYVKRIAGVHGGDIEVDSTPGEGSAFTLVLPAADGKGKVRTTGRRPRGRPVGNTGGRTTRGATKNVVKKRTAKRPARGSKRR